MLTKENSLLSILLTVAMFVAVPTVTLLLVVVLGL